LCLRPTRAEISVPALVHNFRLARQLAGARAVLAVLKANAYGHGAVQVARVLESQGAQHFGVALIEEGLELRNAGIRTPILVMGGSYGSADAYTLMVQHALTPMLFRLEHLEGMVRAARALKTTAVVHLKVDTGMGRLGIQFDEIPAFITALKNASPHVTMQGLLSHFADADIELSSRTAEQTALFGQALRLFAVEGFNPPLRHVSNTAGFLRGALSSGDDVNLVRPGLMLFGVAPEPWLQSAARLMPVLSWKTGITHLKTVPAGSRVSYGGTWQATRPTVVATLPVGYADGFGCVFSNCGRVLVEGCSAPIIGRVTMDMSLIDVTDVPGVTMASEVVLLGKQGDLEISALDLARLSATIPYEVLCGVGARVPRVLVDDECATV
jgi:alanine racemase